MSGNSRITCLDRKIFHPKRWKLAIFQETPINIPRSVHEARNNRRRCHDARTINAAIINNITLTITHGCICFIAIYRGRDLARARESQHVSPMRNERSRVRAARVRVP